MRRTIRTLLTVRMITIHLVALALTVAMVLLGRWQLDVSNAKHFYWQNFIYAIQWWIFSGFTLFVWGRIIRDALRRPDDAVGDGTAAVVVAHLDAPAKPGPALLVSDDELAAGATSPTVYRGYVMPNSAVDHDRSSDDRYRAAFNDQLWQLALADAANGRGPRPTTPLRTVTATEVRQRQVAAGERRPAPSALDGPDAPSDSERTNPGPLS